MSLIGVPFVPSAAGGGPPPFHPLDLSPQFYFDMADASTLYAERTGSPPSTQASVDGVVGSILNQGSAGGYLRAPADGDRAILRADSSYRYIEPDGSNDHYIIPASLSGYDLTICAVLRYTGTTNDQRVISLGRNGNSDYGDDNARTLMTNGTSGGLRVNRGGGGSAALAGVSDPQVVTIHMQSGSPRATIARNGGTAVNDTVAWGASLSLIDQLVLFRNASGAGSGIWSGGRLYMLLIKLGLITGTDLTNLETFAKSRAGIA